MLRSRIVFARKRSKLRRRADDMVEGQLEDDSLV